MISRSYYLISTIILLAALSSNIKAQQFSNRAENPYPKNSIYVELISHGLIYSINFERAILNDFYLRVGGSYYDFSSYQHSFNAMGIKLFGKNNSYLELGAGILAAKTKSSSSNNNPITPAKLLSIEQRFAIISNLGYRHHFRNAIFRLGFQPIYNFGPDADKKFEVTPGVSLGLRF